MRVGALARLTWQDAGANRGRYAALAFGVAVGVGALVLLFWLIAGVRKVLVARFLGVLPGRVVVEAAQFELGPLRLRGGLGAVLDDRAVEALARVPGVTGVLRQARLPLPSQIQTSLGGTPFYSDVIVEGVDPGLVASELAPGYSFSLPGPAEPVPAVLPAATVDVLSAGLEMYTHGLGVGSSAFSGHHFTLVVGASSFRPGAGLARQARVVGISPQVGIAGPSVPLELVKQWWPTGAGAPPFSYYRVALVVPRGTAVPQVAEAVRKLGFVTPGLDLLARVESAMRWLRLLVVAFGLLLLIVAGVGIANGLGLMVKEETPQLGLYRALGASRRDILALVLGRAFLVGSAGSLAGGLGGAVLSLAAGYLAGHWAPALAQGLVQDPWYHLAALGLAAAFGLLVSLAAGWLPAIRATALDPAEALRRE